MCASRFAILLVDRPHDTIGLIATDILRKSEVWLIDIGLAHSMQEGEMFATRLLTPDTFSMTAGVFVPFEIEMFDAICSMLPRRVTESKLSEVAEDRRFAEAIYKIGLAEGVMDSVGYIET